MAGCVADCADRAAFDQPFIDERPELRPDCADHPRCAVIYAVEPASSLPIAAQGDTAVPADRAAIVESDPRPVTIIGRRDIYFDPDIAADAATLFDGDPVERTNPAIGIARSPVRPVTNIPLSPPVTPPSTVNCVVALAFGD